MIAINLHNKKFKALENSNNGEVSSSTIFHYRQNGKVISATYTGGDIIQGFLVGKVVENHLEFTYQHINLKMELMTGKCISIPLTLPDGKIQLEEKWEWTCRDYSKGTSLLIEI